MLTKRQTLWAAPVLIISFGVLCLIGYVSEEFILGKNAGVTALVGIGLVANVLSPNLHLLFDLPILRDRADF